MSDVPSSWPRPPDRSDALLPNDWADLAAALDTLLDTPTERRAAVLSELSAGDPARRATLEQLVAECERHAPLLDRPATERFDRLVAEQVDVPLPDTLGGRYRIDRELGHGGMARVYLARDLKHARDVAVKVIRPDLAASLGRERFLGEIAIAARLRHPNIVPLYDSGDADGVLYFVMPDEDGPSLRTRLAGGVQLPVAECVTSLRDVARALAYAHEHGVVHRDVKPDNVMMSGGTAVVADFGIAKALAAAERREPPEGEGPRDLPVPVRSLSVALGTPAYMAPEQAAGDPSTDHRADIYSFGCLAYELFTGKPPFGDQAMHLATAAHAHAAPISATAVRPDVPSVVAELIARCLEKDPAARPQSARELLSVLDGAAATPLHARAAVEERRRPVRALWWGASALLVGVIGMGAYLATRARAAPESLSLAVLPFRNIGADSTVSFVADGLADEIGGALARVPGIQVKSQVGVRRYRGQSAVDDAEAGVRLAAKYLMSGKFRQERGRWILSADLTRAADSTIIWAEAFDLGPDEQAGAAETISGSLVRALRTRFPKSIGSAPVLAPNQRTSNGEAARLYMTANDLLNRRSQNVKESADLFRRAIRQDSLYAKAYSGLSFALSFFPQYHAVAVNDVQAEVVRAARRALALDPTLAQPHVALGKAHELDWQWDSAETEFRTAIRLDSHLAEAHNQYARHLRNRGRLAEALRELRTARAEDPASAPIMSLLSYVYYLDHQLDSALVESERALQADPANRTSVALGALLRLAMNLPDTARKLIDRASPTTPFVGYVIAKTGDTTAARQLLRAQDAEVPQRGFAETRRSYTYLGLGDTAQALAALERATDAREVWASTLSVYDPLYDSIRESARFKRLLRRVRLDR